MDQLKFQLEMAAFQEKTSLAELEVSKAKERVSELKYEQARFQLEWLSHVARAQEQQQQQAAQNQPK